MKFVKGQRVRITYSGDYFRDTGKIGTIMSRVGLKYYYVYIKGSQNNTHGCTDDDGNKITWQLKEEDFILLESDGQLLFGFMYD